MRNVPSAPHAIPVVAGEGAISINGPRETPLRRRSERSVPAARNSAAEAGRVIDADVMLRPSLSMHGPHAAAGRVVNGVGDRRRGRNGRYLADADAAAEHVIEAGFVKVHVDDGRVGDAGDAVVLHTRGEDVAAAGIDLAR